jgi:hypothetical protein
VLIDILEKDVIPFWREGSNRLATIQLPRYSPYTANLEALQDLARGRADAYQSLDDGLRRNDPATIAKAVKDLKQVDQTAKGRSLTQQ